MSVVKTTRVYLFVLTAMAAKATVCVSPSENLVTAHLRPLGREAMRNVMRNEHSVARSRSADNSRPEALITGVSRWRQNTEATNSVSRMPGKSRKQP